MNKTERQRLESVKKKHETAAWMNQRPNPLPVFRRGQIVNVYQGCGWAKGKVITSTPKGCCVGLFRPDKMVNVYDARCIKPCKDQDV